MVVMIYTIDVINCFFAKRRMEKTMGNEEVLRGIGERILLRRRQLRMTQEELADRMDVSTQMISYAESGRKAIRPENLIKLCAALDVSADYILTGRVSSLEYDRIAQKLSRLSSAELSCVEEIIDHCIELCGK